MCTALEPLLSDGGRIINVCSGASRTHDAPCLEGTLFGGTTGNLAVGCRAWPARKYATAGCNSRLARRHRTPPHGSPTPHALPMDAARPCASPWRCRTACALCKTCGTSRLPPRHALPFLPPLPAAAGKLSIVRDAALRKRFEECASLQELDELADGFVAAVSLGNHRQHGWPDTMWAGAGAGVARRGARCSCFCCRCCRCCCCCGVLGALSLATLAAHPCLEATLVNSRTPPLHVPLTPNPPTRCTQVWRQQAVRSHADSHPGAPPGAALHLRGGHVPRCAQRVGHCVRATDVRAQQRQRPRPNRATSAECSCVPLLSPCLQAGAPRTCLLTRAPAARRRAPTQRRGLPPRRR